MNATDTLKQTEQNEREARANRLLEHMLEDFAKDFMPLKQSLRFHAGLTAIVRQATMDAHRVYGDQLTKHTSALMALHQPPYIVPRDFVVSGDIRPGSIVFTEKVSPKAPTTPGFYWAMLVRPAGMPDNETAADWKSDTFEPVEVFDNGEGDEALMAFVLGRNKAQRLDAFEWGWPVERPTR